MVTTSFATRSRQSGLAGFGGRSRRHCRREARQLMAARPYVALATKGISTPPLGNTTFEARRIECEELRAALSASNDGRRAQTLGADKSVETGRSRMSLIGQDRAGQLMDFLRSSTGLCAVRLVADGANRYRARRCPLSRTFVTKLYARVWTISGNDC
jgi:hypothetical protein